MTTNTTTVEICKLETENALYHKYPQQTQAQPVEVELNCETGQLGIGVNGEIGNGVPFEVYHRRTLRWGTLPLKTEVANEMLEDLAPIAQRILDGYSTSWDGHNYVGEYTPAALAAIEELGEQIDLVDHVEENQIRVWDANDWFAEQGWKSVADELGVTPATTDEELTALGAKVTEEAESSGYCDLLTRADKYLEWLREKVIENTSTYQVTDTRVDGSMSDAGQYDALSAKDACRMAYEELKGNDNSPDLDDLEATEI